MINTTLDQDVVSEEYRDPVVFTLVRQIPIAILCMLILDGGRMAGFCAVAMAGHWLGIFLVMFRRPQTPTVSDLAYVRWGFVWILFLMMSLLKTLHAWLW